MSELWTGERLNRWRSRFHTGAFPGAVAGGVIGLAPGVLLILVLTGDAYYVPASDVLGFIIMAVAAGALLGWATGGACAVLGASLISRLRRR